MAGTGQRAGLEQNRRELCKFIWQLWSPGWHFDEATYDRTAASFDNPDFVAVVIHSYSHRFSLVPGDPAVEATERRLLDEVVDIFFAHPEIHQLRVEARWDRSLPAEKAQTLTDEQAMAVAKYLVDQGVPAERVAAVGAGQSISKDRNIGSRRVELTAINW